MVIRKIEGKRFNLIFVEVEGDTFEVLQGVSFLGEETTRIKVKGLYHYYKKLLSETKIEEEIKKVKKERRG